MVPLAACSARFLALLLVCQGRWAAGYPPQPVAACLLRAARRILSRMGIKSRETIYGGSIRAAAEAIAVRSRL